MGAEGLQRQANFTAHIESRGTDTTVNGTTIKGLWQDADVARTQTYLEEFDWSRDPFDVRFPAAVLQAPYSLKNGMEIVRQSLGTRCVVRRISFEESDNEILQVNALVVSTTE